MNTSAVNVNGAYNLGEERLDACKPVLGPTEPATIEQKPKGLLLKVGS